MLNKFNMETGECWIDGAFYDLTFGGRVPPGRLMIDIYNVIYNARSQMASKTQKDALARIREMLVLKFEQIERELV